MNNQDNGERDIRVLHVSDVAIGGVATLLRCFIGWQATAGRQVTLLAPEPVDGVADSLRVPWPIDRRDPRSLVPARRTLRMICAEVKPDVVHLHSFVAGQVGRFPDRPGLSAATVYQPHSWNFDAARSQLFLSLLEALERRAAKRTDLIVTNCADEAAEAARHRIDAPAWPLGLPVDCTHFHPVDHAARDGARRRLGFDGRRVVLNVGSLCWQKAQERLVAAWERAPLPGTDLILVGAGSGPYLRRFHVDGLRAHAPTQWGRTIHAVGHQADIRPWLAAADVLLQAPRYESQGLAVCEALASGVPVISLHVNGAREVIEAGPERPAGQVVAQGDMTALLRAAELRLNDPSLREVESGAARVRALRLFVVEAVMTRLDRAYREAVKVR